MVEANRVGDREKVEGKRWECLGSASGPKKGNDRPHTHIDDTLASSPIDPKGIRRWTITDSVQPSVYHHLRLSKSSGAKRACIHLQTGQKGRELPHSVPRSCVEQPETVSAFPARALKHGSFSGFWHLSNSSFRSTECLNRVLATSLLHSHIKSLSHLARWDSLTSAPTDETLYKPTSSCDP